MTRVVPYSLVEPVLWQALHNLRDPSFSCEIPIIEGKAAGIWKTLQSFDPPGGIRSEQTAVQFTVRGQPGWDFTFSFFAETLVRNLERDEISIIGRATPELEEAYGADLNQPQFIGAQMCLGARTGRILASRKFVEKIIDSFARRVGDKDTIFGGVLLR